MNRDTNSKAPKGRRPRESAFSHRKIPPPHLLPQIRNHPEFSTFAGTRGEKSMLRHKLTLAFSRTARTKVKTPPRGRGNVATFREGGGGGWEDVFRGTRSIRRGRSRGVGRDLIGPGMRHRSRHSRPRLNGSWESVARGATVQEGTVTKRRLPQVVPESRIPMGKMRGNSVVLGVGRKSMGRRY